MKKLYILASLLLLASCESAETTHSSESSENMKSLTLTVSTTSTQSRVAIQESSDGSAWLCEWIEDDTIEVWYEDCSALSTFSMETYDPELSTFSGSISNLVNEIRVIHTTDNENAILSGSDLTIDISAQNGALDKTYMISDGVVSIDNGESLEPFPMKHVGGLFVLYLKVDNAIAGVEYKLTEISIEGMPTAATIDLTAAISDKLYDDNPSGVITATVDQTISSDAVVEVCLNTVPFTFAMGDSLTFELTFEVDGTPYTESQVKTNNTQSDILFERAKFNYSTISLDGTTGAIAVEITDSTITPWGDGTETNDIINTQMQ